MAKPNFRQLARRSATKYGLDPNIFERQIQQESGFQTGRVSPAGARGIAQIMPATARGWGVNPDDPHAALDAAAKHMASYVKQYGGYKNALVAYNAGPGRVGQSLPAETQNYIKTILGSGKGQGSAGSGRPAYGGTGSTPRNTAVAPADTSREQLALSLLGISSDYGVDPLSLALQAAIQSHAQSGSTGSPSPSPTASGAPPRGSARANLYNLAKLGQDKFGLTIREFAPFDKVDPVHTKGSYHYSGRAFDASGTPQQMAAFDKYLVRKHGRTLKELFYDPGTSIKNGQRTGSIGGHSDHVHVAE